MYTLPAAVHGHAPGVGQLGAGGWAVVAAEAWRPLPATVEITPFETLRMQ